MRLNKPQSVYLCIRVCVSVCPCVYAYICAQNQRENKQLLFVFILQSSLKHTCTHHQGWAEERSIIQQDLSRKAQELDKQQAKCRRLEELRASEVSQTRAHTHPCTHTHIHIHTRARAYTHKLSHTHTLSLSLTHTHTCIHLHTHTYTHTYTHTHIRTLNHTLTHANAYTQIPHM